MNGYFGRKKIKTDVLNITRGNVVEVLEAAMQDHEVNRSQINYLWKVYKGEVPVYGKQKEFRKI